MPFEIRFSDLDQFWQVVGSSRNTKAMMRMVGEERIDKAALSAAEQFVQPFGEVVMLNSFRYVKAAP